MRLYKILQKDKIVKETLISNKFIDRKGIIRKDRRGYFLSNLLDIIEKDYTIGKLNGSLISSQLLENGDIIVKYLSGRNKLITFSIDDIAFHISGWINNLHVNSYTRLDDNISFASSLLTDFLRYLEYLADRIIQRCDVYDYFSGRERWMGTLTELAREAVDKTEKGTYKNLAAACRDLRKKYTIDNKDVNPKSLHILARDIHRGKRY